MVEYVNLDMPLDLMVDRGGRRITTLRELLNINKIYYRTADVVERNQWIPVSERLPKEGEFVLVYGDLYPNKHDGGVIAVSKRMDWNYWQGFGRDRNITHWMPLPEPPKEE